MPQDRENFGARPLAGSLIRTWVLLVLDDLILQCVTSGARREEVALRRAKLDITLDEPDAPKPYTSAGTRKEQ